MAKGELEKNPRHAWSSATDSKSGGLTNIDASSHSSSMPSNTSSFQLMGVNEAEDLVESLRSFTVEEIGCPDYIKQHTILEKLNLLAHAHAQNKTDEFVLEAFLTFGKMETLVQNLIALETWRDRVLPLLVGETGGIKVTKVSASVAGDKTKPRKRG